MDDGTLVPIPAIDFNRIVHIDRVLLRKYPAASVQQIASAGRSWTYFSYRGLLAGAASGGAQWNLSSRYSVTVRLSLFGGLNR
jgi:hypothetical protein